MAPPLHSPVGSPRVQEAHEDPEEDCIMAPPFDSQVESPAFMADEDNAPSEDAVMAEDAPFADLTDEEEPPPADAELAAEDGSVQDGVACGSATMKAGTAEWYHHHRLHPMRPGSRHTVLQSAHAYAELRLRGATLGVCETAVGLISAFSEGLPQCKAAEDKTVRSLHIARAVLEAVNPDDKLFYWCVLCSHRYTMIRDACGRRVPETDVCPECGSSVSKVRVCVALSGCDRPVAHSEVGVRRQNVAGTWACRMCWSASTSTAMSTAQHRRGWTLTILLACGELYTDNGLMLPAREFSGAPTVCRKAEGRRGTLSSAAHIA